MTDARQKFQDKSPKWASRTISGNSSRNQPGMNSGKHIPVPVAQGISGNPFAVLSREGLAPGPQDVAHEVATPKNRGRVDIIRQKAHRGGKTVTVITNFVGIGLPEKQALAKTMQRTCGAGGTVKEGRIEIQGDKREEVARILIEAGFRPVFAGG